jgi:release factor glutamine methyltransferase
VLPNVYEPSDDTFLLADAVISEVRPTDSVLEIGTGCGLIAKLVSDAAQSVITTDINSYAVTNARLNGVSAVRGDLFANLGRRFDLIIFNPPYLPTQNKMPRDWLSQAWDGGSSGREVILRFLSQVDRYLTVKGRVLLLISSLTGYRQVKDWMDAKFNVVRTINSRRFFFETLCVLLGAEAKTAEQ